MARGSDKKGLERRSKAKEPSSTSVADGFMAYITVNAKMLLQAGGAIVAVIFAVTLWKSGSSSIQNLVNTDIDKLKSALTGDSPHLFYCHRGATNENVPPVFSELNNIMGSKMTFGILNCSQPLPKGGNIWDRFKLKREWRPTIFGTAPWTTPKQAGPAHLKDVASLKKYVENYLAPRATEVATEKDLNKFCGFAASKKKKNPNILETCLVIVKGSRFGKSHTDIEEKLVRSNSRVKIAVIDGSKRRLSFEDPSTLPADAFAMKIHALRNGSHYMSMVNPVTWDYVNAFTTEALNLPTTRYTKDPSGLKLMKLSSFKTIPGKTEPGKKNNTPGVPGSKIPKADTGSSSSSSGSAKATSSKSSSTSTGSAEQGEKLNNQVPPNEEVQLKRETEEERRAKEQLRREEMERQAKERLFDSTGDDGSELVDDEGVVEEEDDSIIEL